MAKVIVTLKVMPVSPSVKMDPLTELVKQKIFAFAGEVETKVEIEPVAFGLKSLKILFVLDEKKGSTELLESEISHIKNVNSVEVTDVRRAIG